MLPVDILSFSVIVVFVYAVERVSPGIHLSYQCMICWHLKYIQIPGFQIFSENFCFRKLLNEPNLFISAHVTLALISTRSIQFHFSFRNHSLSKGVLLMVRKSGCFDLTTLRITRNSYETQPFRFQKASRNHRIKWFRIVKTIYCCD